MLVAVNIFINFQNSLLEEVNVANFKMMKLFQYLVNFVADIYTAFYYVANHCTLAV